LLQRVQDVFAALAQEEQVGVADIMSDTGMSAVLSTALARRIVRSDNLEVWD